MQNAIMNMKGNYKVQDFNDVFHDGENVVDKVIVSDEYLGQFAIEATKYAETNGLPSARMSLPGIAYAQESGRHAGSLVIGLMMADGKLLSMAVPSGFWAFNQGHR
jgi:hypothetical protein